MKKAGMKNHPGRSCDWRLPDASPALGGNLRRPNSGETGLNDIWEATRRFPAPDRSKSVASGDELFRFQSSHAAHSRGGDGLAENAIPHVAGGEHARHARLGRI